MKLAIRASLKYRLPQPVDLMLQIEAANGHGQRVLDAALDLGAPDDIVRTPSAAGICDPVWLHTEGQLVADYRARVAIDRPDPDLAALAAVPLHRLPADAVPYLNESRYCPSNKFHAFVERRFGDHDGGAKVARMRDWIESRFTYVAGSSDAETGALDSFVERRGVCRDYAHVMIALARAAQIPARMASVYALGVDPQDFHAVAEVFLDGDWHPVDATGMARASAMARICVGRDAADISFLTAYGAIELVDQSVAVAEVVEAEAE
ncbi:MAG: transglutaminase-like domain-containing protein [Sphingopyxis solisilvae]|uniref:transglutaminase-like domain-containing protein n=1 Tax=Sphingopyxis solisilvae TaxID=1886788 RepID=UPI0040371F2D